MKLITLITVGLLNISLANAQTEANISALAPVYGGHIDTKALKPTKAYKKYQKWMDSAWKELEKSQLSPLRKWVKEQKYDQLSSNKHVVYPFSGPDFLYVDEFLPNAKDYYLFGLEPVGKVEDVMALDEAAAKAKLDLLTNSLYAILHFSFFRTESMQSDYANDGVIDVLFVFLNRLDCQVKDVASVSLKENGEIEELATPQVGEDMGSGVKITFQKTGRATEQTLYYFSKDISNTGLKKADGLTKLFQRLDHPVVFMKAASYLLHQDEFSKIRTSILNNAGSVIQDDSGMPIRFFVNPMYSKPFRKWKVELFGTYTAPINLFKTFKQTALAESYEESAPKPLSFAFGYNYKGLNSNLMVATPSK